MFCFEINGQEERCVYFMSFFFLQVELVVMVKCVQGGKVLNYINDYLKMGDMVEVMFFQGCFYIEFDFE